MHITPQIGKGHNKKGAQSKAESYITTLGPQILVFQPMNSHKETNPRKKAHP